MLIVTDAHVSAANGNQEEFAEMLSALERFEGEIVFLGDIFDLWIGLTRYEEPAQRAFVAWCANRGGVGFVEGNHEFYVVRRHRAAFAWSSDWGRRSGGLLFVHGDLINRADHKYLRWRKLSKNAAMRWFVRCLPFGTRLVQRVKRKMKKTNMAFRLHLPEEALSQYCRDRSAEGVTRIFVGHFHQAFACEHGGCHLTVLPDWFSTGMITAYDRDTGALQSAPWRQLCGQAAHKEGAGEKA